jgi:DNA-directed RNA polymerase specialized sigma24 family protein
LPEYREEFTEFVERFEPRLRQALVGACGPDRARDAAADGLAYAWQHWERVRGMTNAEGYVYRVARSRARPRRVRVVFPDVSFEMPDVEPRLPVALARLSERQRISVLLVHGWDWRHEDVAALLGVSVSTVRNHLARGIERIRNELGVRIDR